ncbi:hypothetical protein PV327_010989, partial [Microctonus hyperodae]
SLHVYKSETIQKYVNYVANPYISAHVSGSDDGNNTGSIFLTFHRTVEWSDNYQIHVKFVNDQGTPSPELNSTVNNLCDQLDIEHDNRQIFSYENIFGLHGLHCPISEGDVKDKIDVIPFDWPDQHTFATDRHCGIYDYQVTLSKCDSSDCKILIVSGVKSYFSAEFCSDYEIVHENLDIVQSIDN